MSKLRNVLKEAIKRKLLEASGNNLDWYGKVIVDSIIKKAGSPLSKYIGLDINSVLRDIRDLNGQLGLKQTVGDLYEDDIPPKQAIEILWKQLKPLYYSQAGAM